MSFRIFHLVTAICSGATLLLAAPAWACRGEGGCDCPHRAHAQKSADGAKAQAKTGDELAATCNCDGPSDCTCKKGQCKCKKCSKHHGAKTQLVVPVHGASESAELPANAPLDASAGFFT